ncbi:MAG: glycogen debranching enzyme N-terminal domain-containing protein [Dysgonomonas sp.]
MGYLKFDKTRMVNLEYSLNREILRTNRKGAYHCTTLVECNTRKQHGLLVMPVPAIDDLNHVLLSSFDETVIQRGAEFNLGIHKYDGDNYSPMGHKYIREFDCESCPKTIYRVGGVVLSKEKLFSLEENNILIRYKLIDAHSPTTLRFKPFLAFRGINEVTQENYRANTSYNEIDHGISSCLYENYPNLYMQFSKKNSFISDPNWNRGIEYKQDMEDGLPYKEDLFVPGYFEMEIQKGETIIFSASDKIVDPDQLVMNFENEVKKRTPRSSFYNCLKNSAHQFYLRPNKDELYLLEGYPWFKVDARAQFSSLPGLTVGMGKDSAFEEVMDTMLPKMYQFMNNELPADIPYVKGLDEPDVFLWAIWALQRYAKSHQDSVLNKYTQFINDCIVYIQENKHPRLKIAENKLLLCYGQEKPVSWMNTTNIPGNPITPRTGFLVDFNALWYNAVMFNLEIAELKKSKKIIKEMTALGNTVKESFLETFINSAGYLFDYVDHEYPNWCVRPNMIYAVSLEYSPLSRRLGKSILDMVTKELLTPKGLRTLSPKSEGYQPYYTGSIVNKDYAYSNGTAWPALLSSFIEAYIKIHNKSALSFIERILIGIEEEMANNCIGSLSQLYDGNPPYVGRGAFSYAPSVAGILRTIFLQKKLERELENEF